MKHEHFNQLTPAEDERLALLMEEMAESMQEIGKIMRHGYESCNPFDSYSQLNRVRLAKEVGHVQAVVEMMVNAGDLEQSRIDVAKEMKVDSMRPYLHHQEKP